MGGLGGWSWGVVGWGGGGALGNPGGAPGGWGPAVLRGSPPVALGRHVEGCGRRGGGGELKAADRRRPTPRVASLFLDSHSANVGVRAEQSETPFLVHDDQAGCSFLTWPCVVGLAGLEPATFGPPDCPPGCTQLRAVGGSAAQITDTPRVTARTGPEFGAVARRRAANALPKRGTRLDDRSRSTFMLFSAAALIVSWLTRAKRL